MSWLSQNWLAFYGSITGSMALVISYFTYRHNVVRDQIRLEVSVRNHPHQAKNVERLNAPEDPKEPWNKPSLVEVYEVVVRNLGSVPAPLDSVGVVDPQGSKHEALVPRYVSRMNLLEPVAKSDSCVLAPRASGTFSVYLKRDESFFHAEAAYAIDQTGKEWCRRA